MTDDEKRKLREALAEPKKSGARGKKASAKKEEVEETHPTPQLADDRQKPKEESTANAPTRRLEPEEGAKADLTVTLEYFDNVRLPRVKMTGEGIVSPAKFQKGLNVLYKGFSHDRANKLRAATLKRKADEAKETTSA